MNLSIAPFMTYIATYERLQKLPIAGVYPGHYSIFGKEKYEQIILEYLEAKRKPGCPAEVGIQIS